MREYLTLFFIHFPFIPVDYVHIHFNVQYALKLLSCQFYLNHYLQIKSLPLLWNTFLKWIKLLNNAREKYITNINLYENKKRSTFNRFQDTYRAPFFFWIPIWWSSIHKPGISKEINFPLISLTCCMFVHIFYGKFTIFSLFALKNPLKNHQHINNNAIRMWNNNKKPEFTFNDSNGQFSTG